MYKRILLCAAFVAALLSLVIGHAVAMNGGLTIDNPTDKFVWITVYTSHPFTTWHISKADCISPKSDWKYNFYEPDNSEVKIRAEVKSGDCRSGNISDTYDVRKDVGGYPKLAGDIYYHNNRYFIAFR